jgi:hypothetical protein
MLMPKAHQGDRPDEIRNRGEQAEADRQHEEADDQHDLAAEPVDQESHRDLQRARGDGAGRQDDAEIGEGHLELVPEEREQGGKAENVEVGKSVARADQGEDAHALGIILLSGHVLGRACHGCGRWVRLLILPARIGRPPAPGRSSGLPPDCGEG